MFPEIKVDYRQFKIISDNYTQSTKTSCDTVSDTRCDLYLPPKATFLMHYSISADVERVTNAGVAVVAASTTAAAACLNSGPSVIERMYVLHGNSAGEILMEVTNHAHNYFESRMQGFEDSSEYGYYIQKDDVSFTGADKDKVQTIQVASLNDDTAILSEYDVQLAKI